MNNVKIAVKISKINKIVESQIKPASLQRQSYQGIQIRTAEHEM